MTPWQTLGVATDVAVPDLRRRYAALIKEFRPETHAQDFARIREAYEVVLTHARRREALAAEHAEIEAAEVATAQVEDVAETPEVVDDAPSVIEVEAAAPIEVIAPSAVEETPSEEDAEPALAAHFRRFHDQAVAAQGSDDEAHLPALRALLQARLLATLDDSQALEFALMRWFIEAESPPLTLLFETGRAFDWHRHVVRLSSWLSPWALRQMEARLALSRDLVYARHFSSNAWLRRLHAKQAGRPVLVWRPAAVEAGFWAERWRHGSKDADAKPLADCLNPVATRRLRGPASTDLLVGLAMAWFASDPPAAIAWGMLASAIVFGLRRALQALGGLRESHMLRRFSHWTSTHFTAAGVIAAFAGTIGLVIAGNEPIPGSQVIGGVLTVPAILIGIAALWRMAAYLELLLAWPWQWREAVDRLEFDRFVRSTATLEPGSPFGQRLGVLDRLKSIREALRLQAAETAIRERPPRVKPFELPRNKGLRFVGFKGQSRWRLLWFGLWVVYAITRLVHAVGQ